jgi:hypothetical protein
MVLKYCADRESRRELAEVTARRHYFKDISNPNIKLPVR